MDSGFRLRPVLHSSQTFSTNDCRLDLLKMRYEPSLSIGEAHSIWVFNKSSTLLVIPNADLSQHVHLNMFYMLKNGMMLYTALILNIINHFNILIFRRTTAEQHVNNLYSVQPLFCGLVYGIYALNLFQIEVLTGQKKFLDIPQCGIYHMHNY